MAKLRLTEEEKLALIEALNNDTEPNPDLVPKLFPSTAEKFDVVSLDRAKVPTLEYAGKRSKAAILAEASAGIGAAPLQVARCFGNATEDEWKNIIVQGDNLQFLKTCYRNEDPLIKDKVKGKVKLVYIDPPFGTGDEYGGRNSESSYSAKVAGSEYIEMLRERIYFLKELLSDDGAFFIRIDHHFGHYAKIVLDEIFGKSSFQNEIMINRIKKNVTKQGRQSIPTAHDVLFVYFKSTESGFSDVFKKLKEEKAGYWRAIDDSAGVRSNPNRIIEGLEFVPAVGNHFKFNQLKIDQMYKDGRIRINPKTQKPQYFVEPKDEVVLDTNWTDISGYSFTTGYPTENSELLLERLLKTYVTEGDIVLDCFAGSGTTPAVAEKLGCKWIATDFGKHSIYTIQRRLMRIGESKALVEELDAENKVITKKGNPYKKTAKPFCVLSSGAYDFSHVMELREHKDNYVNFVLGLFQLSHDANMSKKFKSDIVFAERNGHPVEVYPVWQDEFLKEVRIDESYLEGILTQSGGKLKGEYYIITPETCTNIGDTTLKNDNGEEVTFKMLTFPYKVLEDVSRKLTLQDQPSKPEDVNQLISSTAFYFNEDVEIDVKQTDKGLQINHFETKILDGQGNRFEGYTGLAMLLVDDVYEEGKPFDMDKTVFLKDVKEDGSIALPGLGKSVGVIAIDKHGNESKPVKVK